MDDLTRRGPARAPEPPGDAAVTGVAKGSLGTATALEETQEWVISDLQAPAGPPAEPDRAPRAALVPDADGSAARQPRVATVAAAPAVEPLRPAPAVERLRPSRPVDHSPSTRTAGIAVALLIGAVAVIGLLSSLGSFEAPAGLPPGADQATAAPAATDDLDADDDGADDGDDGGGGGGGNGGGNGNGGGRGNGNGGGNGGGGGRGND